MGDELPPITGSGRMVLPMPTVSGTATVTSHHRFLLDTAKRLNSQGDRQIAVVVAQMACELCAEKAFTKLLTDKGLTHLAEALDTLLPSYNLANEKVRKLYTAVSGDNVQDGPFWAAYVVSVRLRNKVVHEGKWAEPDEAKNSCEAASHLIEHLEKVAGLP